MLPDRYTKIHIDMKKLFVLTIYGNDALAIVKTFVYRLLSAEFAFRSALYTEYL